jgi:hypothetical protein
VTIDRAMVAAVSAPWDRRTRWRQRSMPAATPAEVHRPSSSTKRASGSTVTAGWSPARRSASCQWVTARRPSSRPAWARAKAPAHRAAVGVGPAQGVEYGRGHRVGGVLQAGDHDEVGVGEPGQGTVRGEAEAAGHGDGAGVGGDPAQFEVGYAGAVAAGAPDLGDDGDVEAADAGEGDERHAVHGRQCDRGLGGFPSMVSVAATVGGARGAARSTAWRFRRTRH